MSAAAVIIIVVAVVAVLAVLAIVLLARRQGTQATISVHTEDDVDQRHADQELTDTADAGIELDGHLLGQAVPEPDGPPPVEGAQWDEVQGCWIHWDPAAGAWARVR